MAFDCLMCCGNKASVLRYDQRLEIAREVLYRMSDQGSGLNVFSDFDCMACEPYCLPIALHPETSLFTFSVADIPFLFFVKPIFDLSGLQDFYSKQASLPFETDGFIFTNLFDPAYPFRMNESSIYKWKPATESINHNTIDFAVIPCGSETNTLPKFSSMFSNQARARNKWKFRVKMADMERYRTWQRRSDTNCLLHTKIDNQWFPFSFGVMVADNLPAASLSRPVVAEFAWNAYQHTWVGLRTRNKDANQFETVVGTIENIIENIQIAELISS